MSTIEGKIGELHGLDPKALPAEVLESSEPLVLRNLAAAWPAVRASKESPLSAQSYMRRFSSGTSVMVLTAPPEAQGRFFYDEQLNGFNFGKAKVGFDSVLDELARIVPEANPPSVYVGATSLDRALPEFRAENDIDLRGRDALASVWLGNHTRIAAHYDVPDNLAVVVAGRRRFTLFPPEQVENLYVGPLEFTPAGQPISLVDLNNPDFGRYPRFADALKRARAADLGPGDAILIPSMWWHSVESFDGINMLVNYWWRRSSSSRDSPLAALLFAVLALRDLPPTQRAAWEAHFRHYVFHAGEHTAGHIPEPARRALGPLDSHTAGELRARIMAYLQR